MYSTPSESRTDRFCRLDQERFGDIKDITDKGYYQNSFHYDVRKDVTPFEKLDFEKYYPYYASGGFIHYCDIRKLQHNLKAPEAVWDYSYDKVGKPKERFPLIIVMKCDYDGDFEATEKGLKCPNGGR
ncbi:anaerobic ribonucleoside-triphosphate reductase [Staphylococcus aureus]